MQYPQIDPVALSLGPLQVHWYGIMYLLAFALCWLLAIRRTQQAWAPVSKQQVEDLVFYIAMGIIIGGRLGYCLFYGLDTWLQDPLWVFKIWAGGMSFHGGAIGFTAGAWLFSNKQQIHLMDLLDWVVPFAPIGLFLGRIGNFIGQELWGRAADVPWAIVFPRDPLAVARHPSQLYEALLEGVLLFIIIYGFSVKKRPRAAVSGLFLLGYGSFRFFVEFFREPDAHIGFDVLGWMTRGQLLCLPMLVLGILMLFYAYRIAPQTDRK